MLSCVSGERFPTTLKPNSSSPTPVWTSGVGIVMRGRRKFRIVLFPGNPSDDQRFHSSDLSPQSEYLVFATNHYRQSNVGN